MTTFYEPHVIKFWGEMLSTFYDKLQECDDELVHAHPKLNVMKASPPPRCQVTDPTEAFHKTSLTTGLFSPPSFPLLVNDRA